MTTSQMKTTEWTSRIYQPGDKEQVLKVLRASLGPDSHGANERVWEWKHLSNPFGRSYLRLATNGDGDVIGLRAFMQWKFQANGETLRAVRAVDTATHPDYRRMGIFSGLTKQVAQDSQQDGVDFIFNTPNQFSMPGYLKMGWSLVGTFQPMIKVLNGPRFALGLMRHRLKPSKLEGYPEEDFFKRPVLRAESFLEYDSDIDELLRLPYNLKRNEAAFTTARSLEYLHWRYALHPKISYYAQMSQGDRLDGCAIFRPNTRFGLREIVLTEVLLSRPDVKLARDLIGRLKSSVSADYIIAYAPTGSPIQRTLRQCGFRTVPKMGMDFTARPLNRELTVEHMRVDNWNLSLGDLELF